MPPAVTLIADPRVLRIPIDECHEPLVDLRTETGLSVDERVADTDGRFAHVREGVARRLRTAADAAPAGRRLVVIEGYRPVALQREYFDGYVKRLAAENPGWTGRELYAAASRFVSPPDADPPHSTGGAVDVTLIDADGAELDMGTAYDASPEESGGLCYTHAEGLTPAARENRGLLIRLMADAGFANYATEWWHWSYGDRYWAFSTARAAALYGSLPE
jgi:zinc D-Ala-D-Ala dipeptidase